MTSSSPDGPGSGADDLGLWDPPAALDALHRSFGSYERFREQFSNTALSLFGSGWTWLIDDDSTSTLRILATSNADLPREHHADALLALDVWEHAYYLDHRNNRAAFIDTFFDSLLNWDHVTTHLYRT